MSAASSLAQMMKPAEDQNIAMCTIADFFTGGKQPDAFQAPHALQYFPESIKLNRSVDYATKKPLGGSHPIYQWVVGGERSLSFEAVFTAEVDEWKSPAQQAAGSSSTNSAEQIAQDVGDYLKNPLTAGAAALFGNKNYGMNHINVAAGVSWLMSKTYPSYAAHNGIVKPPPVLEIYLPNAGIATYIKGMELADVFYCIMTRCSVNYTSFFRSGAPRIAEVSMDFDETIQVGSQWGFVSKESFAYNDATLKIAQSILGGSYSPPEFTLKKVGGYVKRDTNWPPETKSAPAYQVSARPSFDPSATA